MHTLRAAILVSVTLAVAGCASAAPASPVGQAGAPAPDRVLTASIPREPAFIAALAPLPAQQASDFYIRMFNAFLDLYDDHSRPLPYLAEALPVLNTDSWVILPDGRMETRYHLKPNLRPLDIVPGRASIIRVALAFSRPPF